MSKWTDKLQKHAIHETLRQLLEWVQRDAQSITNDASDVRRFEKVIRIVQHNLSLVDAELVAFNELDAFNSALRHQNIWNQISSFSSNGNATHVGNANEHLAIALANKHWLVASDEKTVSIELDQLREMYDALSEHYQNLKKEIQNLEINKKDLEVAIDNRRQEVDKQISQWQQQFSEAQEKRSETYQDWKNELDKDIRDKATKLESETSTQLDEIKEKSISFLDGLSDESKKKHEGIQELYELASGDSISGGYAQTAKEEEKQANLWRWISLSFVLATVFWIHSAYVDYKVNSDSIAAAVVNKTKQQSVEFSESQVESGTFNWSKYLLTFSLTGVLLFGAGYTAQQSSKHREESRRTKRFALQIKALDPYISSLEPDDQTEIKKKLTERFFNGVDNNIPPPKDSVHMPINIVSQLVQTLADLGKGK